MVEITTSKKNKEKRMKRIEDSLRDLWDNTKHFHHRGFRRRREKGPEKIFEEIITKNFPKMGSTLSNRRSTENSVQNKPRK